MKIVVIGLGSMGKRRIRLLRELYPDFFVFGVDRRRERREEVHERFGIECVDSIDTVVKIYEIDAAFVCTSPLSHSSIITKCLQNNWNVFTELNLVLDGYERNINLAQEKGCKLFLSSTFLYREEIHHIRRRISKGQRWNYIYHIGQYLPDWHPWEDYTEFFISDKRTNGCREIMAIELPWLILTFGKVVSTHVLADKMTKLNINYCDNYIIQMEHENGNKGVLIIDVVSPVAVRKLEVYSEHKYLQWNGTPDALYEYNTKTDLLELVHVCETEEHREGYRAFIVENAYKKEIKEFVEMVLNDRLPQYGFEKDLEILELINILERDT